MKRKSRSKERECSRSRDKERDSKLSDKKKPEFSSNNDKLIFNNNKNKTSHIDKREKHHKSSHSSKREKEKENDYYRKVKPSDESEKEEGRKKVRALLQSFYGYTDDNNPFGDPDLSKPFIWHKKIQKMRSKGLEPFLDIQSLILKLRNVKMDLDRIRKNKLQRDEIKESQNEQKNQSKETEEQIFDEWKNKDEKFHLAQEKLRTEIRIKQGREKPVDFIHKVLMIWKGFFIIPNDYFEIPEYQKPYLLYDLLDMESLKELYNELNIQLAIDRERLANKKFVCFFIDIASNFKQSHDLSENDLKEFIEYWSAMIIILESYIFPEKNIKNLEPEMREAIHDTLKNRTFKELDEIEHELEKSLNEQIHSADIQFWSNTLSQLRIHRCKMILELIFEEFREKNVDQLEEIKKQIEMKNKNMLMRIYNNEDLAKFYEEEEGNLSPPMYDSDEELRKISTKQHDYLIKLAETRKIILAQQLGKWTQNIHKGNKAKDVNAELERKDQIKGEKIKSKYI
jgi:hypothetical protein